MADGGEKQIADIRAGDEVLSHLGRPQMVTATFARRFDGDLIKLRTRDSIFGLTTTPEHPILAMAVKREVRHTASVHGRTVASSVDWIPAQHLIPKMGYQGHLLHRPLALPGNGTFITLEHWPDPIAVTEEFAWLVGLYLAEGYSRGERGEWSLGLSAREEETLARRAVHAIAETLHLPARLQHRPNNSLIVRVGSANLARAFEAWCGKGAERKRIPGECFSWPRPALRALLAGALDGDGYERASQRVYVTISRKLAYDVHRLAVWLGESVTVTERSVPPPRRTRYDVRMYRHPRLLLTSDGFALVPLAETSALPYQGLVHDLRIENDRSFIANGYAVAEG